MAVPARKTSKSKKNKRRTHHNLLAPTISYDQVSGEFKRAHHISRAEVKVRKAAVR